MKIILFILALLFAPSLSAAEMTLNEGESVAFSYTLGAGTPPFTHQWSKDWVPIVGATAETYEIAAVKPSDAGIYRVKVINKAGETFSDNGLLKVTIRPAEVVLKINKPIAHAPAPVAP